MFQRNPAIARSQSSVMAEFQQADLSSKICCWKMQCGCELCLWKENLSRFLEPGSPRDRIPATELPSSVLLWCTGCHQAPNLEPGWGVQIGLSCSFWMLKVPVIHQTQKWSKSGNVFGRRVGYEIPTCSFFDNLIQRGELAACHLCAEEINEFIKTQQNFSFCLFFWEFRHLQYNF